MSLPCQFKVHVTLKGQMLYLERVKKNLLDLPGKLYLQLVYDLEIGLDLSSHFMPSSNKRMLL